MYYREKPTKRRAKSEILRDLHQLRWEKLIGIVLSISRGEQSKQLSAA
jgi:hypothetical protein